MEKKKSNLTLDLEPFPPLHQESGDDN